MDRDNIAGTLIIAYIACIAGYLGWRLALRSIRRDSELAGLRERVWALEEPIRRARQAEEEAKHHAS